MNQFYYLNEILDKLYINVDKHEKIKIFINDYNIFRLINLDN